MTRLTDAELEAMRGHTRAPFKIEENDFDGFRVYAPKAVRKPFTMYVIDRIGGRMYGKNFDDDREVRANAELFKNAPAMYAELLERRAMDAVVREALEELDESCSVSDDAQYGTLGTSYVRDIIGPVLAKLQEASNG